MATREQARAVILRRANRGTDVRYLARHLNRAVAKVRNRRLVRSSVLVAAGFNPHGPNHRPGRAR